MANAKTKEYPLYKRKLKMLELEDHDEYCCL
jgi:hypothetical protein